MEKLALICTGITLCIVSIATGIYAIRAAVKFFQEEH